MTESAYNLGWAAADNLTAEPVNPFPAGSVEAADWDRGFNDSLEDWEGHVG